jgi:hypothetical protein
MLIIFYSKETQIEEARESNFAYPASEASHAYPPKISIAKRPR